MTEKKAVPHQGGNLVSGLNDIPLSLQQGDNDFIAAHTHKAKTNSLKRFFSKSKAQVTEDTLKESRSMQSRFGIFRKNDDAKNPGDELASCSAKGLTESKLNLHERLTGYWNNVFKRTPKKMPTAGVNDQGDVVVVASPATESPIEGNSPDI